MNSEPQQIFRLFPPVHLITETLQDRFPGLRPDIITTLCRENISLLKEEVKNGTRQFSDQVQISEYLINVLTKKISLLLDTPFKKVINGTGIVLHTGLGRAPLDEKIVGQLAEILPGYTNLEFDLASGTRGERLDHIDEYLRLLTGAELSAIVNNNAAAVLLSINALAEGKEIVVSRGELIEIGGSFRLPDIIAKSGAKMIEIGTTNRTHLKDYAKNISASTGAILLAHPSNYKISGFTAAPQVQEIVGLAHEHKIPVIMDLGSGALIDFTALGLPSEKQVSEYIQLGVDVVTFSGDKLVGGPQAGLIAGNRKSVEKIRSNPFMRAFRCDKTILMLLALTLKEYLRETPKPALRTYHHLCTDREDLRNSAAAILHKIDENPGIDIRDTETEAGSGSLPIEQMPDVCLVFSGKYPAEKIAAAFRNAPQPLVGYIRSDRFHISMKALSRPDIEILPEIIKAVCRHFDTD